MNNRARAPNRLFELSQASTPDMTSEHPSPPAVDGGTRAWAFMVGAFLIEGLM